MLRKYAGNYVEKAIGGIALFLYRKGVTPNMLTLSGLVINGAAAFLFYAGFWVSGGVVILFAGIFDMMDGAVARAGETASGLGGFLDSVTDRYSDSIIFGGVLAYFADRGAFGMTLLVLAIICGAYMVSYVRARAELVIPKCDVGMLERPERILILAAGAISGFLEPALWALAVFTHLTAGYRIWFTFQQAHGDL